jgi:hypothetical protein
MKARIVSGLSAAAAAWVCLSPEAFAGGVATPNNSQTYSAESIALGASANTVLIQGNNFFYSVLGTTMPPGVTVTFSVPTGNTFTNPGAAVCNFNPGAVTIAPVVGTNTIACTAPAGGPYSQVFLTNPGGTGAIQLVGPDVATLGTNRYPGLSALGTNPSARLQINAQASSLAPFVGDMAPLPNFALVSRTSFSLFSLSRTLLIDLTGSGLPANPPGAVFVTNNADGTRATSRSGFLGAFGVSVSQNDLDARTGLNCINGPTNSGNANCAAAITGNTTLTLTGDFATLTGAFLVPNLASGGLAVASAANCTVTPPTNALNGTINAAKRAITFPSIQTPPSVLTSTEPVFGVCLLTNGTQVIQADASVRWVLVVDFGGGIRDTLTPAPDGPFGSITYEGSVFFAQNVFGINNGSPTFFRMVNPSNTAAQVWAVLTKDVPNTSPETGAGSCNFTGPSTATLAAQPVPPNAANPPTTCNISFVANLASQPGLPDTISTNLASGGSAGAVQANNATYVTGDDIAILSGTSLNPVAGQSSLHATVMLLSPNPAMRFSALTQSAAFGVLVQSP